MSSVQRLRLRSFRLFFFLYFQSVAILKKINKNASILNVTSFMINTTRCEMYLNFMFCWPYISIYSCKENQLDALLSSVYFVNQPLHVSGVFIAHHQEVHFIYTTNATYCAFQLTVCCPGCVPTTQDNSQSTEKHSK